jgi:integrase/recombinase XerD
MQTRNYSPRSIGTYVHMLQSIEEYHNTSIDEISIDQVKDFLQYSIETREVSVSYINQVISAVKILQKDVLGREWESIRIKRPRRVKKLPVVLSKEEFKAPGYIRRHLFCRVAYLGINQSAAL